MKAFLVTTQTETHSETTVEIVGKKLRVLQDGSGPPVVVLHHSTGNPGWIPFHEQLAAGHAVSVPDLPGFGGSERPDWARSVRDMAVLMRRGDREARAGPGETSWVWVSAAGLRPRWRASRTTTWPR